jgi:hypothetical protein
VSLGAAKTYPIQSRMGWPADPPLDAGSAQPLYSMT